MTSTTQSVLAGGAAQPVLTPKDLAAQLGVSTDTLKNWRAARTGPRWFRMGPRLIRYSAAEVDAWMASQADAA